MDEHQQLDERIEAYVMGQMNKTDRDAFEIEIQSDSALADAVELHRLLLMGLGDKDRNLFREQVSQVIKTQQRDQAQVKRMEPRRILWFVAAVAIALIGFFAWFVIEPKVQPDKLYAEYFEPYPVYQVSRSEDHEPQFQEAMELYGLERYAEAGDILRNLELSQDQQQQSVRFYLAITMLHENKLEEAQTILKEMIGRSDSKFSEQATWYLALAHLKTNEKSAAIQLLGELSDAPGRFGKLSTELLDKLD